MQKNILPENCPPGFYVVATPIGNLRDITLRALDILGAARLLLAEDTRRTRKLLSHYRLTPDALCSFHDHSSAKITAQLADRVRKQIDDGAIAALVSDAGTPLISDPGFALLRHLIKADVPIFPVPGASSIMAALSVAALPAHIFTFAGFPPPRQSARLKFLQKLAQHEGAIVFFENAGRLGKSLADMAKVFGDSCSCVIMREMTKIFEEKKHGTLGDLAAFYQKTPPKGEITIILSPEKSLAYLSAETIKKDFLDALSRLPPGQAAAQLARQTGLSRSAIYAQLLTQRKREKNEK